MAKLIYLATHLHINARQKILMIMEEIMTTTMKQIDKVIINGLSPTESERPNVQARLDTAHQRFIDIARESVKARQSKLSEKNRQDVRFRISPAKNYLRLNAGLETQR